MSASDTSKVILWTLLGSISLIGLIFLLIYSLPGWNEKDTPEKEAEMFLSKLQIPYTAISCRRYNSSFAICSVNVNNKLENLSCSYHEGCQFGTQP